MNIAFDITEVRQRLETSIAVARDQQALSFELRAMISMARVNQQYGRPGDTLARLHQVYARFNQGFDSADLRAAARLLGDRVAQAPEPC